MYQPTLARFMSRDLMPANGVTVLSPVPDMRKYWHQHADIAGYTYVALGDRVNARATLEDKISKLLAPLR